MRKILIVEDEVYARKSMKKQIGEAMKGEAPQIFEAANGKQGLEIARREEPEVIFTDIRMPVMDGLEFLKEIRKWNTEAKLVIISAYADFEYAKTAMKFGAKEYLLKPIDDRELRECLGRVEKLEKQEKEQELYSGEDRLTKFLSQNLFSETPVKDFVNQNMFRKIFGVYQILILCFERGREPEGTKLFGFLREQKNGEIFTGFRLVKVQKGLFAVVMHTDGQSSFWQREVLKKLRNQGFAVYGGVSQEHRESSELRKAYQQAMTALECKVFGENPLLYYDDVCRRHFENYDITEVQKGLLKLALEKGELSKARTILGEIFSEISERPNISSQSLEVFLAQMSVIFHQTGEKKGERENSGSFSRLQLLDFQSLKEMRACLEEKAELICQRWKEEPGKGTEIIQAMKEYARENYSRDITVKTLAEKVFFMNPAYLSHLFKEKTGESYSSYLRKIRMEKAKGLLAEKQCSITEVAAMVGYNDTSQFIRIFKQELGMTPKKYRSGTADGEENRE